MKVLVCGSRDWPVRDGDVIRDRIRELAANTTVIHGGAAGADTAGAFWARKSGMNVQAFSADWNQHGKRAGILRNLKMLDEEPDLVLAFQMNGSRGTQHTIDAARKRGIPVEVHDG